MSADDRYCHELACRAESADAAARRRHPRRPCSSGATRSSTRPSRSTRLREHLQERVELHLVEDAVYDVGVAAGDRPRVGEGVGLEDDEAAAAVGERAREGNAAGGGERRQVLEVGRTVYGSLRFGVGGIVAYHDEERHRVSSFDDADEAIPTWP